MPVPPFLDRLSGEHFHVDGVEDELHKFREKAGVRHFFCGSEPGSPQLVFEVSGCVALSLMSKIFQVEPESRAQSVKKEKFPRVGRNQDEFASFLEDPGDLLERSVIGLNVLEVIKAEGQVESPIFEGKTVAGELDDARAQKPLSFFEVGHVFVGADPETSLLTDKITQSALAATEVERNS